MLSIDDPFAQDALYHKECMTKYYTHHWSCLCKKCMQGYDYSVSAGRKWSLLKVSYVIEGDSDGPFFITDLSAMHRTKLMDLGGIVPDRIHTYQFQDCIMSQILWVTGLKTNENLYIAC